jgi:hypothetical protein
MPQPQPDPLPQPEPVPHPEPGPPFPRADVSPFSDAAPFESPFADAAPIEPEPTPEPEPAEEAPEEGPKSEVESTRKKIVNAPDISLFEEPPTKRTGSHPLPPTLAPVDPEGFRPGRARVRNLLDRSELPEHIPLPRPTVYGAKAEGDAAED